MNGVPDDPPEPYPTTFSAAVALAAALGACFVGSIGPLQSAPLLLEAAGLALFGGGIVLRRRGRRFAGRALTALGFGTAASALLGAVALDPPLPTLLPLLSCGVGAALLAIGAFPVFVGRTRTLALGGVTLVLAGVLANAVVGEPSIWRSAAAVSLVFLAWDGADRASSLGAQLGGGAETTSVELVGTALSAVVAFVAILLTVAVSRLPIGTSSVPALALLLAATVAFVLALSHLPRTVE